MTITTEMIMTAITALITYIFGTISKKFGWVESKYIPIQNIIIGIIAGVVCYFIQTENTTLITSIIFCVIGSMGSGGIYDLAQTETGTDDIDDSEG